MKLLWFYISRTVINSIKKLFRTWIAIFIGICVFVGIVGGFAAGIATDSLFAEEENTAGYSQESDLEDSAWEEEKELIHSEDILHTVLETGVGIVALAMMLGYFYFADKNGTAIFTMPDVNFLFPAPLKPQSVLLFRTILKMGLVLLGSVYLLFQLPNLVLNLGLNILSAVMLIVAWVVIVALCQLISVFTYTVAATHEKLRKFIRPTGIAVLLAVALVIIGQVYIGEISVWTAVANLFASKPGRWIPVWGWVRGFVMSAIEGNWLLAFLYFVLLLLTVFVAIYFIWKFRADFYEDALASAVRNQEVLQKTSEAKSTLQQNRKRKNAEKKAGEFARGEGAQMFLIKSVYNRRRFAKLGLFTGTSTMYLLVCGGFALVQRFLLPSTSITIMSAVVLALAFFRNFGNPIARETECPYLFTVPEKPSGKLFYCLLAGLYDILCDMVPVYLAAVLFMNGNLFTALLWILLFLSFDLISSVSGLLLELWLPSGLHIMIRSSLQLMLKLWPLIPNALILIGIGIAQGLMAALPIAFVFNLAFAALLFAFCPALLYKGRN
ncbi:MAG: putative ABC exporter domain-containing protein [Clostridia bacterium]|nr:putative ABC exporter domain-containing protein [Clostridia bacterium]